MRKYGGGFSFCYETKGTIKRKMSNEGYVSFKEFLKNTKHERRSISRIINGIKYIRETNPIYLNALNARIGIKMKLKSKPNRVSNPGIPSDLFFWSVKIMKKRYLDAIEMR